MISIIIPAYNAAETLPACLAALRPQLTPPAEFEMIVVDDGSSDDTAQLAADGGATVLTQRNAGPAAARNLGAQHARGDLLLFTDADCVPAADWVTTMSAPFADETVVGAKGGYITHQLELTARFVQMEYQSKYDRLLGKERIDFIDTYSAGYRRDVFLAMGGFDETLRTNEDVEFAFRLAEAGHRLIYTPDAKVAHIHDRHPWEYTVRKFRNGVTKNRVVQRHPGKIVGDSHTPPVMKLQLALAGLGSALLGLGFLTRKKAWLRGGLLAWVAVMLSDMGLYRKIWRRDRSVLLVAPWLVLARALALGWGLVAGAVTLFQPSSAGQNDTVIE